MTTIQIRRGTATQWTDAQTALGSVPVLSAGEWGLNTDVMKVKIGDGVTLWDSLSYYGDVETVQTYVKNNTGSTMYKGQAVYISGASGANVLISLAEANGESTSSKTLGLLAQDLTTGSQGYVITNGIISKIDTSAYSEGTAIWLSPSVAGGITSTKPVAPNHLVYIGVVTRSHAVNGEILVKVQNGYEIDELHDVLITSKTDKDLLTYESSTGLWKNKSFETLDLLTATSAASTYLTQSSASSTYLTQSSAASTYLTQSNAASTYASLGGSYSNPSWITGLAWSKISSTPTTLAGYGITDAITASTASSTYAPLASPGLTGVPTAPTATSGTNTTQIATTAFVSTAVANLVSSAPTALDTLNELAAALGNDPNFATTISTALGNKQPLDADLTAIAGLTGTSGLLKKTAADTWTLDTNSYYLSSNPSGYTTNTGTVTSVSVTSANGFTGTVATDSTTPAITISTSITGIIKGNGTAISAAISGTDYLVPPSGTALLKANSGGALANAVAGTDYLAPPSGTSILKANSGGALSNAVAGTDYLAPPSGTSLLKANSGGALANATASDVTTLINASNISTSGTMSASTLTSTVASGTAPLTVTSTTQVANLTSNYTVRGAIYGTTVPTTPSSSNMVKIYVSSTAPTDMATGDVWIGF